jgi:putative addiction module component (TIGR02574 family)
MTIHQIASEALGLPPAERAVLAQQLWDSVYPETAIDQDAIEEAERRDAELDSGLEQEISHEELMAAARKALRCE